MNWKKFLNPTLIATIVAGIQAIHGDAKKGADKKQLAMESLGLAVTAAPQVLEGQNAQAASASAEVAAAGISIADAAAHKDAQATASASIDAAVAAFKLAGVYGFKQ